SSQGRPPASPGWRPSREDPVNGKGARVSVAEEPSSEMPSTCRPWSPCATTQTSSGSMKGTGRPESHQSWPSLPSCESSSSSQTPSSETSAAGSIISLDQHGYSSLLCEVPYRSCPRRSGNHCCRSRRRGCPCGREGPKRCQ